MKIIITERQMGVLEKNPNSSSQDEMSYIEEKCNNIYRTVMSSSVLEILDGDVDIDYQLSVVENLKNKIEKLYNNDEEISDNAADSKERNEKLSDKLNKINVLENVLLNLSDLSNYNNDKKVNKTFDHNEPKMKT